MTIAVRVGHRQAPHWGTVASRIGRGLIGPGNAHYDAYCGRIATAAGAGKRPRFRATVIIKNRAGRLLVIRIGTLGL